MSPRGKSKDSFLLCDPIWTTPVQGSYDETWVIFIINLSGDSTSKFMFVQLYFNLYQSFIKVKLDFNVLKWKFLYGQFSNIFNVL